MKWKKWELESPFDFKSYSRFEWKTQQTVSPQELGMAPTYYLQPCPTCGRSLQVRIEYLGREVICYHCNARFTAMDPDLSPSRESVLCEPHSGGFEERFEFDSVKTHENSESFQPMFS